MSEMRVGETFNIRPGTWAGKPTSVTTTWRRQIVKDPGEYRPCTLRERLARREAVVEWVCVGTGDKLMLSKEMVGETISCHTSVDFIDGEDL